MTRHVFPPPDDDKTFLTISSICRRTTVDIHRCASIVGFPYKYRHFYAFHVNLPELVFLSVTTFLYQPKKEFVLTERTKNHLRNPPGYAMLHVVGQKYNLSGTPMKLQRNLHFLQASVLVRTVMRVTVIVWWKWKRKWIRWWQSYCITIQKGTGRRAGHVHWPTRCADFVQWTGTPYRGID